MFIHPFKKLNKRGFTLIELTMVMAISAIITTMIISFSTLISAQTKKNELRADFMQDVIDFRTDLQIAFAEIDNGGPYNFTVEGETIKIENTAFEFSLSAYEYIDEVSFSVSDEGEILKVLLTNTTLTEEQSFVLISKTENTFNE